MIINDIADSTHEAGPVPVLRDACAALLAKRRASEVCKPGSMETATTAAHQDHLWILALHSLLWAEFFQSIVLQWVSRSECLGRHVLSKSSGGVGAQLGES
jgi:hypothetical protein